MTGAPPAFTTAERRLVDRLRTPEAVHAWLRSLPYNWEHRGETLRTFRGVVQHGRAHCAEAALAAACILEQNGFPPLLLDIASQDELDHVVFLFKRNGRWGTIGRSRCHGLHGRKPVFPSVRAVVESYAAPFIDDTGRVTGFGVLDLRSLRTDWRLGKGDVWAVEKELYRIPHQKFHTPEREYRRWFNRYAEFAKEHPHQWPTTGYPGMGTWMGE